MAQSAARRGSLAIFVGALLWSTGGLFIKTVSLDAWGVSFWRSSFAALTLFVVYLFYRDRFPSNGKWLSKYVLISAFTYALLLVLFVIATKLTTSANAIFLQYTAPIYVLFAEPILSKTKMRRSDLLTVGIMTLSMALFFIGKFETRSILGNVAALASGVAFAAYALLLKHERATTQNRWQIVIIGHIFIAAVMAISAMSDATHLALTSTDFEELLYLGVIQIGIAYAFFTYGIGHVRAIDATLICMVEPVLNPVWVYLGIGERPTNYALLGGAIILTISLIRTIRGNRELTVIETARAANSQTER